MLGIFTGRLLFRIYQLLPELTTGELRRAVRWDGVVSLLQRMQYIWELVHKLQDRHGNEGDWILEVLKKTTQHIHNEGQDWYEHSVKTIVSEAKLTSEEIELCRREDLAFAETMKYLQLGNPESILICPDEISPEDVVD